MKHIIFVSKEQWKNLKEKKIKIDELIIYGNPGKKSDWLEGGYPPVKIEISLREVK